MEDKRTQRWGYLKNKATVCNLVEEEMENGMDREHEDGGDEEKSKRMVERVRYPVRDRTPSRLCQVDKCTADLSEAKQYYRRHKVCEIHAKAYAATIAGVRQRFCQQCSRFYASFQFDFFPIDQDNISHSILWFRSLSRFHELPEFDEDKRSCRRRLAGHNERRRKSNGDSFGEGSGRRGFSGQLSETPERNRVDMKLPMDNSSLKRPEIR